MKTAKGEWRIELWVHCPHCDELFEFVRSDPSQFSDAHVSFEKHEDLDFDAVCPECKKEFKITEVSW